MLDLLRQDLSFAWRALRRSPVFTVVAVTTLALAVGANTAIFSLVDGILLRPLALREPDRLVVLGEASIGGPANDMSVTTPGSFFDWQRGAHTVRIAGYTGSAETLTGHGEPERLTGASTVGGLFDLLGVPALLGRGLHVADEESSAPAAVVLSHGLWSRMFGRDPGVIGRTIVLAGTPRTVVGVMPVSFRFPNGTTEYWTPSQFDAAFRANRDQYRIQVVGRLAPDVSLRQAEAELAGVATALRRDWPLYNTDLRIAVRPLRETVVGDTRTQLMVLMGAVGFVLLIACANIGNLLLARASGRRREMATRRALGAAQGRIARQLLTESLLLSLVGGGLGVLVGEAFLRLLLAAQVTLNLPRAGEISLNPRVLLFTLGISVAAGLFFGSFPAWQLWRAPSSDALRSGTRSSARRHWGGQALVVVQLALALVLLTGAGLLMRSFAMLQRVDVGITTRRALAFGVGWSGNRPEFVPTSLERLRAIPGVTSAAVVSQLPITGPGYGAWFNRLDRPLPLGVKPTGESYRVVSLDYFKTIGISLRAGRLLNTSDRLGQAGVVINQALAKKYYPGEDPLGKVIYLGAPDNRLFDHATIVGVVGDTRDAGVDRDPLPIVYIPLAVIPGWSVLSYVIQTTVPPLSIAAAARGAIHQLDPMLALRDVRTIDAVLAESVAPARWSTTLLTTFAGIAFGMAALGVFGILSFGVTQRTRELGIRAALGATPSAVGGMVVRQGMWLVIGGLVIGLAGAFALTRTMQTMLYGVLPNDLLTYAVVCGILAVVGALACYLPARRAMRLDPVLILRAD